MFFAPASSTRSEPQVTTKYDSQALLVLHDCNCHLPPATSHQPMGPYDCHIALTAGHAHALGSSTTTSWW
jgi:hypothetical protein